MRKRQFKKVKKGREGAVTQKERIGTLTFPFQNASLSADYSASV